MLGLTFVGFGVALSVYLARLNRFLGYEDEIADSPPRELLDERSG